METVHGVLRKGGVLALSNLNAEQRSYHVSPIRNRFGDSTIAGQSTIERVLDKREYVPFGIRSLESGRIVATVRVTDSRYCGVSGSEGRITFSAFVDDDFPCTFKLQRLNGSLRNDDVRIIRGPAEVLGPGTALARLKISAPESDPPALVHIAIKQPQIGEQKQAGSQ